MFADDINIKHSNLNTIYHQANEDLNNVDIWLQANNLSLIPLKQNTF